MPFLLERIALNGDENGSFNLRHAIAGQIQRLVNARNVNIEGDMSLLAINTANLVDLSTTNKSQVERYALRLKNLILRYEPRLLSPSVSVVASSDPVNSYRLIVKGSLPNHTESETFYFELPK